MNGGELGDRLTSWKEVAAYLGREVRTVQRWEKRERLPVHRHHHERSGTIYAFKAELDAWLQARRPTTPGPARARSRGRLVAIAAVALAALSAAASLQRGGAPSSEPAEGTPAFEAYLRGRHLLSRGTERGYRESVRYFEEAVRIEPGFARAHVGLADAYLMLGRHGHRPPAETLPRARVSALEALALDPSTAEVHSVLAGIFFYWDWDFPAAESAYRRALDLDPTSARSHHGLAHFLSAMGRHDEAIEASRRAQALEPLSVALHSDAGWFFYRARRYDEALVESRRALELEPGFGSALSCIVSILTKQGQHRAAVAELHRAAVAERRSDIALLLEGPDPRAALERFRRWRLERLQQAQGYVTPFAFAAAHARLGELDAAFAWLDEAYETRDRSVLLLNVNPGFDPLRGDPRLARLAARVGLPHPPDPPPAAHTELAQRQ